MKKRISVIAAALLLLVLTACGNTESSSVNKTSESVTNDIIKESEAANNTEKKTDQTTADGSEAGVSNSSEDGKSSEKKDDANKNGGTLVVYFSATGNTKRVAEKIADVTGADIYEIKAAEEYSDADLDWHDSESRSTKEQNDSSARPEIGSSAVSLDGYSTVYIGYPIWWGEEPRIMDTFVEKYNFDGKTMIPFCTSSSSGMGRSGKNLAKNAGSGNWLDGKRFGSGASEDEIRSWIEDLQ